MKKILSIMGCILISSLYSHPDSIQLTSLEQPLMAEQSEQAFHQVKKSFLQKYPSSRKLAIFTTAAMIHVGALTITSIYPCAEDQCRQTELADWLLLTPTLANIGSSLVSLYDERKKIRAAATLDKSNV